MALSKAAESGIIGLEQGHRGGVEALGLALVAARFGDAGKIAVDLRAQPDRRRDAAAADRDQLGQRRL